MAAPSAAASTGKCTGDHACHVAAAGFISARKTSESRVGATEKTVSSYEKDFPVKRATKTRKVRYWTPEISLHGTVA